MGRIANRTAKGKFSLNGKEYTLAVNNGPNNLHNGLDYYDARLWNAKEEAENAVTFTSEPGRRSGDIRETPSYPSHIR